ncbi:uncharacterized protein LOC123513638 isoform X1 [Portunus trituberculatus]|uniref:uncharacterized protein LOC123513638 isoform X1 n=1 Tax=Portunus trituberculatus TaxID=210409 RepID=UPI001E1CFC71|nr:uncharacterized protein LOC123513638 isoform X1 [Portunus trituberculatus]
MCVVCLDPLHPLQAAAWWAVVAVAAAATLAEEQSGGESSPWLPATHTASWPWWAALGGDANAWYSAENGEGEEEEASAGPWLAKRQPPHRLGSLVDLYRTVARGLDPFTTKPVMATPERRSGRWPAACKFNPFGFVCWNSARRGPVMRQRPLQYTQ